MSANVDKMMYYGEKPWHGIGTELDHPATSKEAIKMANLDWEVCTQKIYVKNDTLKSPIREVQGDFRAVVRMDTDVMLGVVKNQYRPLQNVEAFQFFDSVVGEGHAVYHVAGSLGAGEVVWILAKIPGELRVKQTDDIVEKYLLLANRHDGYGALRMMYTPVRVVCQNTLSYALQQSKIKNELRVRHFQSMDLRIQEAKDLFGLATKQYNQLQMIYDEMASFEMNKQKVEQYIESVFPAHEGEEKISTRLYNTRCTVAELFESPSNMIPGTRGTLFVAYSAVTEFIDHVRMNGYKDNPNRRLNSIWFGGGAQIKQNAFNKAVRMLQHA